MFNLGGDDKEKLKENMEEIKDLVNSQQSDKNSAGGVQEDNSQLDSPPVSEDVPENKSLDGDRDTSIPDETVQNQLRPDNNQGNSNFESESISQENVSQEPRFGNQGPESESKSFNNQEAGSTGNLESKLSKIKGTRSSDAENNVSHGEPDQGLNDSPRDTLFLEVNEFNRIQEMVDEMKYLSREMNDLMENLEGGVEEDRRLESEAQDVVDEFSQRRDHIESSIS